MPKKYKLKCFYCGERFFDKTEVYRINGRPICGMCLGDISSVEQDAFEDARAAKKYSEAMKSYEKAMEEWRKRGAKIETMPSKPLTQEERELKNYLINRYGEW